MRSLNKQEHDKAVAFVEMAREAIAPLKIVPCSIWDVEAIFGLYVKDHDLSICLQPDENDIRASESFGLSIRLPDFPEMPIACVCARKVSAPIDFVSEWITTYRLFGEHAHNLDWPPFEYVDEPPKLSGTIGYGGGSWVHPDWRGQKLWAATSRLGKLMAVTVFHADYYVALMKHERTQAARETLGWPNSCHLTTGHHAGRKDWQHEIDMHWMSRAEIVASWDDHEPILDVGRQVSQCFAS